MTTVSVVTPTYRTPPDVLARTWASLRWQSFRDWEWVVWDDTEDESVWRQLYGFSADERYRLTAHRSHVHSGSIGQVKRRAFMSAEGDILVELDHDDELMPSALFEIVQAFEDPEVGFVYSDWSEFDQNGRSCRYGDGWAFGFGDQHQERDGTWVMHTPPINETTIQHIVSVPNHVRAWRASTYRALGGHDPNLPIADDYDLIVRTVVAGIKTVHVPKMLYRQHIGNTAQRKGNSEIQRLVPIIAAKHGVS